MNLNAEQRKFVSFWKLVSNERKDETGKVLWVQPGPDRLHHLHAGCVHDGADDAAEPEAVCGADPTPDEALHDHPHLHELPRTVLRAPVRRVRHSRSGRHAEHGPHRAKPQQRWYQFVGNRLLLQPPPTFTPDGHTTTGTITWEKVAPVTGTR